MSDMPKAEQIQVSSKVKKEVADSVKVKQERSDRQEFKLKNSKETVEMDDLWQQVKTEIREQLEQDAHPSSFMVHIPENHIKMKGETGKETQVPKRRRLTQKTIADSVKIKLERPLQHELNLQSQEKGHIAKDDVPQVKTEIKEEEVEDNMAPSSFGVDIEDQIKIEEEAAKDLQRSSKHSDAAGQSKAPQSQATELENQVAKRRRLTQKTSQIQAPSPVKKEVADRAKIKKEMSDGQEFNLKSLSERGNVEMDDLWLRVRKEIEKQSIVEPAASTLSQDAEQSACDTVERAQDSADASERSLDAFAREAATWAKLCLAFRSSQTWSPTRPCCPANFFLGASGTPSAPSVEAPACVLRLTARGLRCLHRFHEMHSQSTTAEKSEAEMFDHGAEALSRQMPASCSLNTEELQVRGRDCMKMWPWMRDLPTLVWAGRGWVFDENGLRRLSSAGGSNAMQGVEVFESMGAAPDEMNQGDEHVKEVAVPTAAVEHAAPPADVPKPTVFMRHNLVKQSGVPNVKWDSGLCAWQVKFPKLDSKGNKIGSTNRVFAVKKFLGPGIGEAEADAAALQAAKNFRAELVKQGVLSELKAKDPSFTSEVPGVTWINQAEKWRVRIYGKGSTVGIYGGLFTDKAAAEAKALELQQQHGLERQVKPVSSLASLPVFHPKVPCRGVYWRQTQQHWHAVCWVDGVLRNFRVKPKEHSEEELERSFKVAVAWKKKQEKEKAAAVKARKKQRS